MAKELKSKGYEVIPGQSLCRQCVKKYDDIMTDDQTESEIEQIEVDVQQLESENDYSCETPKKKLNTSLDAMGVSPVCLHGVAQHSRASTARNKFSRAVELLKTSLSDAYDVNAEQLNNSDSGNVISELEQKASELDRLHQLMKDKLTNASHSEKIQILTLAPDSWSRKYCAEYFNVSEYSVRTARELKKAKGILAKPTQKLGGKAIPQETIDLVIGMYEDDEFSRQMPGKKDYVSISKGIHKQKRLILCNLKELYAAFKEKYPNIKIGFSKFCMLRPKWCVLAGSSGTHSVCVCSIHQNATLIVDAIDWDITYKDLISKLVCDSNKRECMMHRCEFCPGRDALKQFLDDQLSEIDAESEFHYNQWDNTDRASLSTVTTTCEEYKEILVDMIDKLTKHSYLAKCQAQFLNDRKQSLGHNEAIVLGDFAENYQFLIQDEIQSYHWSKEYCTLHPVVVYFKDNSGKLQHLSICFISDDNTHDTCFVYEVQTMVIKYIQELLPNIKKLYYFSDGCGGQYKNYKNFMNLCLHKQDFGFEAEWIFFAQPREITL